MPPVSGFSHTSDVDNFLEETVQDLNKLNGNAVGTGFAAEFVQEQDATLEAAARWSRTFDPEAYARATKLAPEGVPPEVALRQKELLEDQDRVNQYREVFKKAPQVAGYFVSNPKDIAYANPDELDNISGINWAVKAGGAAFVTGQEQTELALLRYAQMAGTSTPADDLRADELALRLEDTRTFGNHGDWLSSGLVYTAQSLPFFASTMAQAAYRGIQGAVGGAAVGGGIGLFGGPSAIPGAAAGFALGGRAGMGYGSLEQSIKLQAGLAYQEFLGFRDEQGNPLDPQTAKLAAILTGIGAGGLEQLGLSKTIGQIPGLGNLVNFVTPKGMAAALKVPGVRTALTNFAKNLGTAVTVETLTEMGQEGLAILFGEIGKELSGQDFQMLSADEATQRVGQAGVAALQMMTLMAPVVSGTRFGADLMDINRSKRENDRVKAIGEQLAGNQFVERAPEVAAKVIDEQNPDQKYYIPARQMVELFQTAGEDVYGPPIPNWRQRLDEALAIDDDVEVTMGEFYAFLAKDPKHPLYDLVKTDPRNYAPSEIKEYSDGLDELVASDLRKAELQAEKQAAIVEGRPPQDNRVRDLIEQQVAATGFLPEAAKNYAMVLDAYVQVKARQTGMDPVAWVQQYGPQVLRDLQTSIPTLQTMNEPDVSLEPRTEFVSLNEAPEGVDAVPREGGGFTYLEGYTPAVVFEGQTFTGASHADALAELETALGEQAANKIDADPERYIGYVRQLTQETRELRQDIRGSIAFDENGPAVIRLFEKADMSTLLHETGHFFLETTRLLKETNPEIKNDWDVIVKHLKIENDKITREQHEQWARMTEAYFMEGKSPSPELRGAFAAFRQWLKVIYQSITRLGGSVHPEIAKVFDNMLRVEQAVQAVAQDSPYKKLFDDAVSMGIDPEEYLAYQGLVETLREEAQDISRERLVGQEARLQKGWRKEIYNELVAEATEKLKTQPPYSHLAIMRDNKFSINEEEFKKRYGPEVAKKFPAKVFKKQGLVSEVAANLLGYNTADEMVYDFTQAPPLKDAAKELALEEMSRRYGEGAVNQDILNLQVKRAFAQEARLTVLGTELKALNRKAGREVSEAIPKQIAKEVARRSVYTKKFMDISTYRSQALVDRLARQAENAVIKADWSRAADLKRKQLVAQAILNEVEVATRTVTKLRDKAARYTRTTPKGVDPSSMEQIRDLVTRYEFAKRSVKSLRRREKLGEYLARMREDGLSPIPVPERLIAESAVVNYKQLTVEELLAFGDVLDNLEHMGRLKHKLRVAKNNREFGDIKTSILERIKQAPGKPRKMKHYGEEERGWRDTLWEYEAILRKPEQIVEFLDMGDISGPMMENVFQPINEAQNKQNDMTYQYNRKIMSIFEKIPSDYLTEVVTIQSLGNTMTRQQIYAVALNTGNYSNLTKLTEGHRWSEGQLAEILSHMKKEDWDRVQSIWDMLEGLWGEIAALEKRLTGVAPPKIEARAFNTPFGEYKGGYYPVIYDFKSPVGKNLEEDTRPEEQRNPSFESVFGAPFIPPGTNHTHTYARKPVSKPIKLQLSILPSHLHQVIHDLAYREPVRNAFKILWDPQIRDAIITREGQGSYDSLTHWLRTVASERPPVEDQNVQLVERLRLGATIYGMGFRVTTALAQPLGLFPALLRVKPTYLLQGIYQMTMHPRATNEMIAGLSGELRHRFNTFERDLKDTVKRMSLKPSKLDRIRLLSMMHIGLFDKYTSNAVWLGRYLEAREGGMDQDAAIMDADRTVRLTQGTGNVKDMARIQTGSELNKLFTMFYSFFSAQYNMQVYLTRKTKRDIADGDLNKILFGRLPDWLYLVAFPAVLGAMVSGQGPEEDEDKVLWTAKTVLLYPFVAVPIVRDIIGSAASGFDYKLSPAGKAFEQMAWGLSNLIPDERGDVEPSKAIKPAITAAAIAGKLPAGQATNTFEGLWYGLKYDDLEFNDLLYGRRDKPR